MTDLTSPIYRDDDAARQHLEAVRWGDAPYCPFCGSVDDVYRLGGKAGLAGLLHCKACRKKFSVTVGTLFERSHIPLPKWLLAVHFVGASKKAMSAHQLHRMLGLTYKSAWFMVHRIRDAMRETSLPPLGGANQNVEADETFIGGKEKNRHAHKRVGKAKEAVVALVERDGRVRAFHTPDVTAKTLKPILLANIDPRSRLQTDEAPVYRGIGRSFAGHGRVNHSAEEYVRQMIDHTNTAENFFSILKRGIYGTYHHVSSQHLAAYLNEFSFRYDRRKMDDDQRAVAILRGITGKRLTYRRTGAEA